MLAAIEEFQERLQSASELAFTHLAKFRTEPPVDSGLDSATYQRLFAKALADAYASLDSLPNPDAVYAQLDRTVGIISSRISASPILQDALQDSGVFAAEGSARAYVLGSLLRELAPESLSEFGAAVLKIPVQSALDLEPALEAPGFG